MLSPSKHEAVTRCNRILKCMTTVSMFTNPWAGLMTANSSGYTTGRSTEVPYPAGERTQALFNGNRGISNPGIMRRGKKAKVTNAIRQGTKQRRGDVSIRSPSFQKKCHTDCRDNRLAVTSLGTGRSDRASQPACPGEPADSQHSTDCQTVQNLRPKRVTE
jgi:hypothetical protein